jgi:glycosyltransferase involved in cell wall biosynthesis
MKLKKYACKQGKKIKWVSDFRDAWTGYLTSPKRWLIPSMIDKHCEKRTLEEADALTIVANGIKDDFDRKYPEISGNKNYVLIRNGFDGEDFRPQPPTPLQKGKFTIVYTGSMYGKMNPYFFIETMTELVKTNLIDRKKLKIVFAGRCAGEIHEFLRTCDIREVIEFIPYLPHSESVQLLLQADVMLLLIDEDKHSKMILSGKVFEYLGACAITGKPILAIAPEGEAADVIRGTRAGDVIPHNDKEKLAEVLFKYYDSFLKNIQTFWGDKEAIKKYERKNLTKQLVKVFDEISK